jgi:hypothetical protein
MMEQDHRIDDSAYTSAPPDPNGVIQTLMQEDAGVLANTNTESEIPDKFRGKSFEDAVKMYQELESRLGKQGQELGELRRAADSFIQTSIPNVGQTGVQNVQTPPQQQRINYEDLSEPEKIQAIINQEFAPIQRELLELKKEKMELKLKEAHPDFVSVVKDPDFQQWLLSSDMRKEMFVRADKNLDYAAANELFTNWKAVKGNSNPASQAAATEAAFQAGRMDSGQVAEAGSKPIYRRADIIALKTQNPQKYAQLENQIYQAYAEGRVR